MSIDVSRLKGPLGELMDQFSGRNAEKRFQEFLLWLKRVGAGTLIEVNRSLTAEQAVNATGRSWWHKDQHELDSAPVSGPDRVEQIIFEIDYEPTPAELDQDYRLRDITPDLLALSKYMCEKPEAADDRPLACQWGLNPDGTAAYAIFDRIDRDRKVSVNRSGFRWHRYYRFVGFRKVSALD